MAANNRIRPNQYAEIEAAQTPRQVQSASTGNTVSELLYADPSLTVQSSYLYGAARVIFGDDVADDDLREITSAGAGFQMDAQGKPSLYSFLNQEVDVMTLGALVFEKMVLDIYRDAAIVSKRVGPEVLGCDDFKITWGVRNRLASPRVRTRAQFVMNEMLGPNSEIDEFFANKIGTAASLAVGAGWCDSIGRTPVN